MARIVKCVKLGREAEGLDFPPLPDRRYSFTARTISSDRRCRTSRPSTM